MTLVTPFASVESHIAANLRFLDSLGYVTLSDPNLQSVISGFCNTLAIPDTVVTGVMNADKDIVTVPHNEHRMTLYAVNRQVTKQVGMPAGPPFDSFVASLCTDVQAEVTRDLAAVAQQQTRSPWKLLYYFWLYWMPVPVHDQPPALVTAPPIDDPVVLAPTLVSVPANVWRDKWVMRYAKAVFLSYVPFP